VCELLRVLVHTQAVLVQVQEVRVQVQEVQEVLVLALALVLV
jgi:hypothetical protein